MTETKCNLKHVLAWYEKHDYNASATARRFKVSRQTIHNYLNKLRKHKDYTKRLRAQMKLRRTRKTK